MSDTMRFVIKKLLIGVLVVLFVSALVFSIMQQLSQNLRKRTKDYVEVCRTIHEQAVKEGNA